jgi:hypothetical protein
VSGFLQAREVFENKIAIGEIWLAWTEDPNNTRANELREERSLRVAALTRALPRWQASGLQPQLFTEVLCFFGKSLGARGNSTKGALACLTRRKDARLRYLTPGGKPIEIPGVEGARVYVLGPPADDRSLGKLLPRKGSGEAYELRLIPERAFFAALDLADSAACPRSEEERPLSFPFDEYYRIAKTEADNRTDDFFRHHYYGLDGGDPRPLAAHRRGLADPDGRARAEPRQTRSRHAFRAASRKPTSRAGRAKLRRATLPCPSQSEHQLEEQRPRHRVRVVRRDGLEA